MENGSNDFPVFLFQEEALFLCTLKMTCSSIMTVRVPMMNPLPTIGRSRAGKCSQVEVGAKAMNRPVMRGRPTMIPELKSVTHCSAVSMERPLASWDAMR